MTEPADRARHLFIVRLWCEPHPASAGQWRGSVEHVPSGYRLYFVSFNDLSDFINLRLGSEAASANGAGLPPAAI